MADFLSTSLLDPQVLARIRNLQLLARETVERALTGIHRSNLHGSSIEFTEHKEYSWGDDVRNVDWKLFGKSDRYFIKQFEHETAVPTHVVLDVSGSMAYGAGALTKWEYAARLAASVTYLLLSQKDPVGLAALGDNVRLFIPPRSRRDHLHNILMALAGLKPVGPTGLVAALDHLVALQKRRGMVILIGDFLDPDLAFLQRLTHLAARRNDLMLFQVLDPTELEFPFEELSDFVSLEGPERLLVDPRELKEEYLAEIGGFLEKLRSTCADHRIDYRLARTDEPIERVLTDVIALRSRR